MISGNHCLPIEIFEGAGGDLILLQEFPGIEGERFVRVFINMDDAEKTCEEIMRVAMVARAK